MPRPAGRTGVLAHPVGAALASVALGRYGDQIGRRTAYRAPAVRDGGGGHGVRAHPEPAAARAGRADGHRLHRRRRVRSVHLPRAGHASPDRRARSDIATLRDIQHRRHPHRVTWRARGRPPGAARRGHSAALAADLSPRRRGSVSLRRAPLQRHRADRRARAGAPLAAAPVERHCPADVGAVCAGQLRRRLRHPELHRLLVHAPLPRLTRDARRRLLRHRPAPGRARSRWRCDSRSGSGCCARWCSPTCRRTCS